MNILIEYFHTKHVQDICETGYNFYVLNNQNNGWDGSYGQKPNNLHFDYDPKSAIFDSAIVNTDTWINKVKSDYNIPIIAASGGQVAGDKFINASIVVGISKENLKYCQNPNSIVIPLGADPEIFNGYGGLIPYSITMAHGLDFRKELRKELVDEITNINPPYYSNIFLGAGSGMFANGMAGIPSSDVVYFYRTFRCFVYTPVYEAGMGYAVTEAMMTGMPCILTEFSDWKHYIVNWESGIVSNDISELRDFYKEIISNLSFAQKISNNIRPILQDNFTLDIFCAKWKSLLEGVV
jgi:hypothetical protein